MDYTLREHDDVVHVVDGKPMMELCKWAATVPGLKIGIRACGRDYNRTFVHRRHRTVVGVCSSRVLGLGPSKKHKPESLMIYITKEHDVVINQRDSELLRSRFVPVGEKAYFSDAEGFNMGFPFRYNKSYITIICPGDHLRANLPAIKDTILLGCWSQWWINIRLFLGIVQGGSTDIIHLITHYYIRLFLLS